MNHPSAKIWLFVGSLFFSFALKAAPAQIFGPKGYKADPKTASYAATFASSRDNSDGVITVMNADGKDLTPVACPKSPILKKVVCELENVLRRAAILIFHPSAIEIRLNNVVIVNSQNLPPGKGQVQVAVKVQKSNSLSIKVKGLWTASINIGIKAESAVANQLPLAKFTMTPTSGIAPELVSFSALTSSDPDGDAITNYSWEFGDGGVATGAMVTHNFATVGTFNVKLTVTDARGGKGSFTQAVVVRANQPPIAAFSYVAGRDQEALKVDFNASLTNDPDGAIVGYSWNFGDGQNAFAQVVQHTFLNPGTYTVILTVTDSKGATASKSQTVTVFAPVLNEPPVAKLVSNTTGGNIPVAVMLDSSASTDPNNDIASYFWDFGDGNFQTTATPIVSYTYQTGGSKLAIVTITDSKGLQSSASVQIFANTLPVANLTAPYVVGVAPFAVSLDASKSLDPDMLPFAEYQWSFGDGQSVTTSAAVVQHVYASKGTFVAKVTVVDSFGATASSQIVINVVEYAPPSGGGDEGESSVGVIQLANLDKYGFNRTGSNAVFQISGAQFSQDSSEIYIYRNGLRISNAVLSIRINEIEVQNALVEGENRLEIHAVDHLGHIVQWSEKVWAGSRTLRIDHSSLSSASILTRLTLSKDNQVFSEVTHSSAAIFVQNVPKNEDIFVTSVSGGYFGSSIVIGLQSSVAILMKAFEVPISPSNNDFNAGLTGWNIQNGFGTTIQYGQDKYLQLIGTPGMMTKLVHTYKVGQFASHNVSFRLKPQTLNDRYSVTIRNSNGAVAFESGSAANIFGNGLQLDSEQPWIDIGLQAQSENDLIEIEVSLYSGAESSAQWRSLRPWSIFLPDVANAAAGATFELRLVESNLAPHLVDIFGFSTSKVDETPVCEPTSLLDAGYLSVGYISPLIRPGNMLCGILNIKKFGNLRLDIDKIYLETVPVDKEDQQAEGVQQDFCSPSKYSTPILQSVGLSAVTSQLNAQPNAIVSLPKQQLFMFPSTDMNGSIKVKLRLRVIGFEQYKQESGLIGTRRLCITKTIPKNLIALYSQNMKLSGVRFGVARDGAETAHRPGSKLYGDQGGDDWIQPHILPSIEKILSFEQNRRKFSFNDFSNMNGGLFAGHKGHDEGVSVDIASLAYNNISSSVTTSGASDVIAALNNSQSEKAYVTKVHVTVPMNDQNEVWRTFRLACLKDGRRASSLIKYESGHIDHWHFDFNVNPESPPVNYKIRNIDKMDFSYTNDGSGQFKFKIAKTSDADKLPSGTKFAWQVFGLQTSLYSMDNNPNNANPSFNLLPGRSYSVRLIAFYTDSEGVETCGEITKEIYAYTDNKCDGEYGNTSPGNFSSEVRGFISENSVLKPTDDTKNLPLSQQKRPYVSSESSVCGTSSLVGSVVVGLNCVIRDTSLAGNVTVYGSHLKGTQILIEAPLASSISVTNVKTDGSVAVNITNSRSYTLSAPLDSQKFLKISGIGRATSLLNPFITGEGTILDSDIDFQNNSHMRWNSTGEPRVIQNSSLVLRQSFEPAGKFLMTNAIADFDSIISRGNMTISGNVKLKKVLLDNVNISGTANLENVQVLSSPPNLDWNISGNLTNVYCTTFVKAPTTPLGKEYYVFDANGTRACRAQISIVEYGINVTAYGLVDYYVSPGGGN